MKKFKSFLREYLPQVLITLGLLVIFLTYWEYAWSQISYYFNNLIGRRYELEISRNVINTTPGFLNVVDQSSIKITPVDRNFGLVIEKINLNAPIVKDVSILNENDYVEALRKGVAHASFSGYPTGENSNVYLFAHSTNNFWQLGRYSTVFNNLDKLAIKDRINLFYEGKRYVYEVENKFLVKDFKVDETIYEGIGPSLTLQTCYPAGTTLNRLIIRAGLIAIFED